MPWPSSFGLEYSTCSLDQQIYVATQAKNFFDESPTNRGHFAVIAMARGNQRDKAREATQKKMADQVSRPTGAES